MHQYNDGKDKSGIAKRFGLGKKQSAEKMTEAERVEMELRFMVDHFLPFDKSKDFGAVKGLGYGVAPPLPPIPSSVTAVPVDSTIAAQSSIEEGFKYGEDTPMESFLKSNPLLDFRDDENLVSRISFTPSSENDGSMEGEGRTSQLLTSLYSTRDFGKNVGLSVVVDTVHVANVTESSSYGLAVNAGSSLEAGTFSGGAMSPLAVQARYDDRESRKYGASPAAEVSGNRF
ncbi:hypothetical protein HDU99_008432 [Rhizoclosmatium hyalinum]|nr:hypothetical protein HDU99_008432 [Rhizoclosmatium hyalinum]